ncbi:hypothetical protein OIU78_015813 [Salix suchowensis]|nr:hypothetical protein OIU78_015813 [Salix suchowensis]
MKSPKLPRTSWLFVQGQAKEGLVFGERSSMMRSESLSSIMRGVHSQWPIVGRILMEASFS